MTIEQDILRKLEVLLNTTDDHQVETTVLLAHTTIEKLINDREVL